MKEKEELLNAKLLEADLAYQQGEMPRAGKILHAILKSSPEISSQRAEAIRQQGRLEIIAGDYKKSQELTNSALIVARQSGNAEIQIKCYATLGSAQLQSAAYEEALKNFYKACELAQENNLEELLSVNYSNMATAYTYLSEYELALKWYEKTLQLSASENSRMLTFGNLAVLYKEFNNLDLALEYNNKAFGIAEKLKNRLGVINASVNIALIYLAQKEFDRATDYFDRSIRLSREMNYKHGLAVGLGNIALAYIENQRYEEALTCINESLRLNKQLGNAQGYTELMKNLAYLYSTEQYPGYNLKTSESYCLKALKASEKVGTRYAQITTYQSLTDLYRKQGKWKKLAQSLERMMDISDSIKQEEAKKKSIGLHFQRDIDIMEAEHRITESILHKILPKTIAERIKKGEEKIMQRHEMVTVLFADMVGFTQWSKHRKVEEVAENLDKIFNLFDQLAIECGVEKIKTIGDAYMCVAGLPEPCTDHAERCARLAMKMLREIAAGKNELGINIRIGIHSGEVIAGVLGKNKYAYDLWGDAVNTASRMESHGQEGKIQVSEAFYQLILQSPSRNEFSFTMRGPLEVKGKGIMKTYFLSSSL